MVKPFFSFFKIQLLDRYLLKELISPFLMGVLVFTFIFMVTQMFKITEMILNKGVPLLSGAQLMLYLMPSFLVLVIPSTVLLASLVAFGRLAADSEAVALLNGGVSFYRMLKPVFIFSSIAYLVTMYIMVSLVPKANFGFTKTIYELVKSNAILNIQEKVFFDGLKGLVIYVDEIPEDGGLYQRILITDHRDADNKYLLVGKEGEFGFDKKTEKIYLKLFQGEFHQPTKDGHYRRVSFEKYRLFLDTKEFFHRKSRGDRELTVAELKKKIKRRKQEGKSYLSQEVELYKKYSLPFSALMFGLLGAPIGIRKRSRSQAKFLGFVFCIGIVFIYYIFLRTMETLGDKGVLLPWLSVWIPNVLLSVLTLSLIQNEARQRSATWLKFVAGKIEPVTDQIKKRLPKKQ